MAQPPPPADHPSTSGNLGYFHLRIIGPTSALLLLRSDRLYSLSLCHRRGHRLRLLLSFPHRRRARDLLLSTSGCALRLTHCSSAAARVNGRPLCAGTPTELAVGDEVSVLRRGGARYGFVVERFVSCGGCEGHAAVPAWSCQEEGLAFRAESLRKRLRAISKSHDPLSFLRESDCSVNESAAAGVKEFRRDSDGELCLDHPISPAPENLRREDCNLAQKKMECYADVVKDDVELRQRSKMCGDGDVQHKRFSNGSEEQCPIEGCYSDGSTFFLNRLVGIMPDARAEPHSGVTLPQLLHPVNSLLRVFIATFTSDISWFLEYCKIPQHLPVTIACHNKERCWSTSRDNGTAAPFESHPNVLLV